MGSISADKQKAIQLAMDQIERRFGKGYIMKLGGRMLADVPVANSLSNEDDSNDAPYFLIVWIIQGS